MSDPALAGSDALTTAKVLAAAVQRLEEQTSFSQERSHPTATPALCQNRWLRLGLPSVTFAKKVTVDGSTLNVDRQTEAGYDEVTCPLPALVSVTAGVVEPRYPSFKGIMAAKSKPVETVTAADLGVTPVGWEGSGQTVASVEQAPAREAGTIIEDDGESFGKIVEYLETIKVI